MESGDVGSCGDGSDEDCEGVGGVCNEGEEC